jgi:hypothetical protein
MNFLRPLIRPLAALAICGGAPLAGASEDLSPGDLEFFESRIRPILSAECYKCHAQDAKKMPGGLLLDRRAGWVRGGDSGAVIVPGDPDGSLLVKMVTHDPDYEPMPPKSKLKPRQIADLREWVRRGAPDPRLEKIGEDVLESEFDLEERKEWWSLQPVAEVAVPEVDDDAWPSTDYDRFVLARLEENGWQPALRAPKEVLLRRVTLTLTGLAPTERELSDYLADESHEAYERVVERLLASPHFGERWARHWMDVVRFAETKAFEQDYYSFYGMLRSSRLHYANVADPVGTKEMVPRLEAAKKAMVTSFLPVLEENAGRLPGVLAALQEIRSGKEYAEWRAAVQAPVKKGGKVAARDAAFRDAARGVVTEVARKRQVDAALLMNWLHWLSRKDVGPELAVLQGFLDGKPAGALDEQAGRIDTVGSKHAFGLGAESLGEWIASGPGFRPVAGDGVVPASGDGAVVRAMLGTGAAAGLLSGRLDGVLRSPDFVLDGERVELWARGRHAVVQLVVRNYEMAGYGPTTNRLRVTVDSDRWKRIGFATALWKGQTAYLEVQHNGAVMKCLPINARPAEPRDDAWVAVASGALPQWGQVWLKAVSKDTDPAAGVAQVVGALTSAGRKGELDAAGIEVLGALVAANLLLPDHSQAGTIASSLARYRELAEGVPRPVYVRSVVDGQSHDEPVYVRGDHKHLSEEPNPRHFFDGLGGRKLVGPGSGRLEWAELVADPANPLTARVRVNRIWSRVFARGLVASVDDFGKMGELPSHPELLDFLARDFVESGWSTKGIIRKMVLSSTFRIESTPGPGVAERDPKNILLQHMPVRRMDAEAVRDHILACSGELKPALFGPSVPANIDDQPASRAKPRSGPLDGMGRRSVYLELRRNFLPSFLRVFDMPNASEPSGRRNVTNVPAQSLALMNERFVHAQARAWARRLLKRDGSSDERVQTLHRQAFGREAGDAELAWGHKVLEEFEVTANPEDAWAALCHLMINRKEFIYVF